MHTKETLPFDRNKNRMRKSWTIFNKHNHKIKLLVPPTFFVTLFIKKLWFRTANPWSQIFYSCIFGNPNPL